MKFSANLGFLWNDRPLPDAIRAAKAAGFDAVECHWPYDYPTQAVKAALDETKLVMLGLNTARGNVGIGEFGLCALPNRVDDARCSIDQAIRYARAIRSPNIHVMAGNATGADAHQTFIENLKYACAQAAPFQLTVLIEPMNTFDVPNYFLTTTSQAIAAINTVNASNLKLMFDCYHVKLIGDDVMQRLTDLLPHIGHIQIASVPDRGTPDHGDVDYTQIFKYITALEYNTPLGAEYRPVGDTDASLGWLRRAQ